MKRTWKGYLFAGPLLLGFLLFYVLPFGQVVWGLPVPRHREKASCLWAWKITAGCSRTTCSAWPLGTPWAFWA